MLRAGFLIVISGVLLAQEPIRVNSRLVQVNVVVRDSHGPVTGLSKSDFTVFDKGKQRPIAVFVAHYPDPKERSESKSQKQSETPPPGVVTNRTEGSERPVSATVLLIDALNTDFKDQQTARKQILKFIASMSDSINSGDRARRVAIYLLNTKIRVLQDFTDDPAKLKAAIEKYQGESSASLRGANEQVNIPPPNMSTTMLNDPTVAGMLEAFNEMSDAHQVDRAKLTANALEQIAVHLARVSGRKTLVWVSSGFPFYLINDERHSMLAANREERTFQDEVTQSVHALSAADIAIYPVDARGIVGMPAWDVANPAAPTMTVRSGRGRFGTRGNGQLGSAPVDAPDGFETMDDLAAGTGGRAFHNSNDLQAAVATAMEDADSSYTIAFYALDPPDDSFHPIKVKVNRAGAEARYRSSYYSTLIKPPTESDRMALLESAARSALDATGIGLAAAVEKSGSKAAPSLHVALRIDVNDLSLDNQTGKWSGGCEAAFITQSADGATLATIHKTITLALTDEVYAQRKQEGIVVEQMIAPDPKIARIRIAIVDHRSGVMGSLWLQP